jgi:predicted RNA-binding protein with PUA-like domain
MTITEIVELVRSWENVLVYEASQESGSPEIAWGDTFFFYAPDGQMPNATQPFATTVTKDYPDDTSSLLDRDGIYRVNIHPGRPRFKDFAARPGQDASALDTIIEHPVYGEAGWLAVLNPGPATDSTVRELLQEAYELDRTRYHRRRNTES